MIVTNSNDLKKYLTKKTAAALGSFDAVHKGHLSVIEGAVNYAKKEGLHSLVQLVETDCPKVNSLEKRLEILENAGVDFVVVEKFTEEFRTTDYKTFVKESLVGKYNAQAVFTGENYRFGYMAKGDVEKLSELCQQYNIKVFVQKSVMLDTTISSTEIRKFVKNGNLEKAKEYMSRPFSILGTVVSGKALGKKLGFPTANIDIPESIVMPPCGVYATKVLVDGERYDGITNVGTKPTVDDQIPNIETHLIGFSDDIYGKKIEVEFHKKLRDILKFDDVDKLKKQIEKDKIEAKEYFDK